MVSPANADKILLNLHGEIVQKQKVSPLTPPQIAFQHLGQCPVGAILTTELVKKKELHVLTCTICCKGNFATCGMNKEINGKIVRKNLIKENKWNGHVAFINGLGAGIKPFWSTS